MRFTFTHPVEDSAGNEREWSIDACYTPGEPRTWHHPGCDPEIEIYGGRLDGRDYNEADLVAWIARETGDDAREVRARLDEAAIEAVDEACAHAREMAEAWRDEAWRERMAG